MTALVDALKELIANDRTLMLPAIGALGEVRLTETLRPELAKLAFGALPLADEGDVPTLARVLLESAAGAPAARQLRELRQQVGAISYGTLSLLLQVVANALRLHASSSAKALIAQCAASPTLSRWDTTLLFTLLPLPRHRSAAMHAPLARSAAVLLRPTCFANPPPTRRCPPPPRPSCLISWPRCSRMRPQRAHPYGAWLAVSLIAGAPSASQPPPSMDAAAAAAHSQRVAIAQQSLSELLSALFSHAPAAAAAAATAFGQIAVRGAHALGGADWSMLQEAMAHAPRIASRLLPPLCACLAAGAAVHPALRPPLLIFVQKHAFVVGGPPSSSSAAGASSSSSAAPPRDDEQAAAAAEDEASVAAAFHLAYALLCTRGALSRSEAADLAQWLLQAAPPRPRRQRGARLAAARKVCSALLCGRSTGLGHTDAASLHACKWHCAARRRRPANARRWRVVAADGRTAAALVAAASPEEASSSGCVWLL